MCIMLVVLIALPNLCRLCIALINTQLGAVQCPKSYQRPLVVEHGACDENKWQGRIGCNTTIRLETNVIDLFNVKHCSWAV